MADRSFMKMVEAKWPDTLLCVGLDTDPGKISKKIEALIRKEGNLPSYGSVGPLMLGFNKRIIEATKDLVCTYKLNLGFYLAQGIQGLYALQETVEFIGEVVPDAPVIIDGKFGDIGSSAAQYARFAFEIIGADAVTVNPYLGQEDAIDVFLKYENKGIFVLCRTSNEGAKEFQNFDILGSVGDQERYKLQISCLYGEVSKHVSELWNGLGNCGLVTGATYPGELKEIRRVVGDMPILIPGVGTQGGDLEQAVKNGVNSRGDGIIINSSSGILYKSTGSDFAEAAREEAKRLRDEINEHR